MTFREGPSAVLVPAGCEPLVAGNRCSITWRQLINAAFAANNIIMPAKIVPQTRWPSPCASDLLSQEMHLAFGPRQVIHMSRSPAGRFGYCRYVAGIIVTGFRLLVLLQRSLTESDVGALAVRTIVEMASHGVL